MDNVSPYVGRKEKSENSRLTACFQRGERVFTIDKNYDYAHELFSQCVIGEPANVEYAQALVRNLREKQPQPRRKHVSPFRLLRSRKLRIALKEKAWQGVLQMGIDMLKSDPWNVTVLRSLAEASAGMHHNEVELVFLKQALDAQPKSIEVNRHCARSLGRMGQFDQAISCWHRVELLKGGDEEATHMISHLSQEKLMYPGGRPIPPPSSPQDAVATNTESASPAAPELALTPRQLLEFALRDDPANLSTHLQYCDLLINSEEYVTAKISLERAIRACGEQPQLVERLGHVRSLLHALEVVDVVASSAAGNEGVQPYRMPWVELLFIMATIGLTAQLFPTVATAVWESLDFRRWSRRTWFFANVVVLLVLTGIRFWTQISAAWKTTWGRRARHSVTKSR
jgi:hypothetical protein